MQPVKVEETNVEEIEQLQHVQQLHVMRMEVAIDLKHARHEQPQFGDVPGGSGQLVDAHDVVPQRRAKIPGHVA